MLIRFSVSNYLSFQEPVELTTRASREKQHGDRLFTHGPSDIRLVPITAIFGGNAAGKSNFYKAVEFVRKLVLRPPQSLDELITVEPFLLDDGRCSEMPCRFVLEILPKDTIYRLTLAAFKDGFAEERLEEVRGERAVLIYSRERQPDKSTAWNTEPLEKRCATAEDRHFIRFKTRDTLPNQLFLSTIRGKCVPVADEVAEWFSEQLALMLPDATFKLLEFNLPTNLGLREFCGEALQAAHTGIEAIQQEDIAWDDLPAPPEIKETIQKKLGEGQLTFLLWPDGRRFSVTRRAGELRVARLYTLHRSKNGKLVRFELANESEGTRRLMDLLPAFFELVRPGRPKVFVIDELDRSLHALLARHLIESYLALIHPASRCQLIFTTHDVTLLDQDILRRDEIWLSEKSQAGVSTLKPLSEVEGLRYDKDIRKSYLSGEYGGIPQFPRLLFKGGPTQNESISPG